MPAVHWVEVIVAGHCVGVMVLLAEVPPGVDLWPRARWKLVGVRVEHFAHLAESVVGEEVEQLVFEDGAADGAAELLLLVGGLGQKKSLDYGVRLVVERVVLGQRVKRVERGIAQK